MNRRIAIVLCAIALVTPACGGGEQQSARPRSSATLVIAEPKAGDVVDGKTFMVRLRLEGGRIVNVVSQDLTSDEGHVHVSIDGKIISQTFGLKEKVKTPTKGSHLLQAEFVAKDHGPFSPRVLSTVTFTVR
jgi:hypothetical protein